MDLERSFGLMHLPVLVTFMLWTAALCADSGAGTLVDDATVYEEQPGNNGGGDSDVCIGNHAIAATRRAFVRYTLPAIPAGSTVDRVVLALTQVNVRTMGTGSPKTASLLMRRVITAGWVEGTGSGGGMGPCGGGADVPGVDWATQPAVAGNDSASEALSAIEDVDLTLDTGVGASDDGLIADVQAWVDDGATNFGWRLAVSEEATADNARRMRLGTLTIHWTPPPLDVVFADSFESP